MNKKILEILEKDFEELNKSELQILRNETRKIQGIQGRIKNDSLLDSYLNLKRKHVQNLEQVLVSPKLSEVDFGPFAGKQTFLNKVVVSTFESVNKPSKRKFYIDGYIYLPVLTVSYLEDKTEVICLSPEGEFCKINNKELNFEI